MGAWVLINGIWYKAQPQQAHPSARGAVVQGPRTASSGKSPRDPAGDWCNGPCSKGQAPASKGHGPHSKAKGPRPEEQGPRCKIQHSRSAPRSKRPGPMSLAHRPWPRTLGSIPKVKVSSWKRRCQVSCGLGIRTPPHGPRSNLQPRWGVRTGTGDLRRPMQQRLASPAPRTQGTKSNPGRTARTCNQCRYGIKNRGVTSAKRCLRTGLQYTARPSPMLEAASR
jgi:hypothetical protein